MPYPPPDMRALLGTHDLLWVVLDALRWDVAESEWPRTPQLRRLFPAGWEKRHSPGSFTWAAHQAFFAGFLPTPADPAAPRERLFALEFGGSETTGPHTAVLPGENVIGGLRSLGFYTLCLGGVGFFNGQTPLSRVFPALFDEAHWQPEFGVTGRDSPNAQFDAAAECIALAPATRPLCTFLNVAALHQPNYFFLRDSGPDDLASHAAALRAVDAALPRLLRAVVGRPRPTFAIFCSDHGTLYGEDGWIGHRVGHPDVWTVPYAHAEITPTDWL